VKLYRSCLEVREKMQDLNSIVEKRTLENELNHSIQNKLRNNIHFLKEARTVIMSKKDDHDLIEAQNKVRQIEINLEQYGFKTFYLRVH
jgi:hypothetical protein